MSPIQNASESTSIDLNFQLLQIRSLVSGHEKKSPWETFLLKLAACLCERAWWRNQMETFSALLALCAGNSPVSPHKGQWRGALMLSLICAWLNGWVNTREAGDLRRYRTHYDVIVMDINVQGREVEWNKILTNSDCFLLWFHTVLYLLLKLKPCWWYIHMVVSKQGHYWSLSLEWRHMDITASHFTGSSTVCCAYQRKHQSSTSLTFVRGSHWWLVDSLTKGQLRRKSFHLMTLSWLFAC